MHFMFTSANSFLLVAIFFCAVSFSKLRDLMVARWFLLLLLSLSLQNNNTHYTIKQALYNKVQDNAIISCVFATMAINSVLRALGSIFHIILETHLDNLMLGPGISEYYILTLILLVANLTNTKWCKKADK